VHPAELREAERVELLAVLNSERFVDRSPAQVWAILLDEGVYLGSVSTMYRLLRAHEQTPQRRAQATHPAKKKPELLADGPNQVWTWDITKLTGPIRGVYYDLYGSWTSSPGRRFTSTYTPPRPVNSRKRSSTRPSPTTTASGQTPSTPTAVPR
jgi:hypothetical protein